MSRKWLRQAGCIILAIQIMASFVLGELTPAYARQLEAVSETTVVDSEIKEEISSNNIDASSNDIHSPNEAEETIEADGFAADDFETKVVGNDGVAYENVDYLSIGTLSRLDEETRQEYYDICDQVAKDLNSGIDADVVIAVDDDGKLTLFAEVRMLDFDSESKLTGVDAEEVIYDWGNAKDDEIADRVALLEYEDKRKKVNIEASKNDQDGYETEDLEIISENMDIIADKDTITEEEIEISPKLFDVTNSDRDYFRNQLSTDEKIAFDSLCYAAQNGNNVVKVFVKRMSMGECCRALDAALNTYVGAFDWFDGHIDYLSNEESTEFTLRKSSYYSADLERRAQSRASTIASNARADAKTKYPNDIPYGIIEYINAWVCQFNYYNYDGVSGCDETTQTFYNCHSSYGVLLAGIDGYGYGVCESYAKATSRILDCAGIRNLYVTGTTEGGNHAWNYVYLNGKWYVLDTTWNDGGAYENKNYFLVGGAKASDCARFPIGSHYKESPGAFVYPSISNDNYSRNINGVYDPSPEPTPAPLQNPAPVIKTSSLTNATINRTYSVSLSASGSGSISWYIDSGSLPKGLSMNNYGYISGTPTAIGTYRFTVKARNSYGENERTFTINVNPIVPEGVTITDENGTVFSNKTARLLMGRTYIFKAIVAPSDATNKNVTWSSDNTDVATVSSTGVVTPKEEGTATIRVLTVDGNKAASCKVTVVAPPTITKTVLKEGRVGEEFSDTVTATGTGPITWSYGEYTEESMKANNLSINPNTGVISGIPRQSGKFAYSIVATNAYGIDKKDVEISINVKINDHGIPEFLTDTLPDATVGEYYKGSIPLSNGGDVYLEVVEGKLPNGLFCTGTSVQDDEYDHQGHWTDHRIEGMPIEAGIYEFTLKAKNSFGSVEKKFTLKVNKNLNGADAICGDNASFKLYEDGTLVISGTGALYDTSQELWAERKEQIRHIVVMNGINGLTDEEYTPRGTFKELSNLESVILPEGIKDIPMKAFKDCSNLKEIVIPSGVEKIGASAFAGAGLQSIWIPKSIKNIGAAAFSRCSKFTDVYYEGTEEQWNQIEITYINDVLLGADIHFDSKIEKPVEEEMYTVKFVSAGETYKTISVYSGKTVQRPADPTRVNYRFDGWYSNETNTLKYDFNTPVTQDIVLYAKWVKEIIDIPDDVYIVAGQKINLPEVCFADIDERISRYVVDDKTAASISKTMLSGKKAGTVNVTAQRLIGKNSYEDIATCTVTVLNKPKLKFTVPMTYEGQVINASDYFTTSDTNTLGATYWESSNPYVVEVIDKTTGQLNACNSGSAKITAYFGKRGKTGTYKVTATLNVKIPSFQKNEYKLLTGGSVTLAMKNVTAALNPEWEVEDPNIATASAQTDTKGNPTGKVIVSGLNAGNTRLKAIIDGQEYYCEIYVDAPVINKRSVTIKPNRTATVSLKNTKINKMDVEWNSTDPDVAKVYAGGVIKAVSRGQTIIYTETGGVRNECVVTVK